MQQWSRTIRWLGMLIVVAWAFTIIETQLSRQFFRDPYEVPTPPYVAVAAVQASHESLSHRLWIVGRNVVLWIRWAN